MDNTTTVRVYLKTDVVTLAVVVAGVERLNHLRACLDEKLVLMRRLGNRPPNLGANVVAGDEIWVRAFQEVDPGLQLGED